MNWYLKVLKQYADFSGRARRKEYWMFLLFHLIAIAVVAIIDGVLGLGFLAPVYMLGTFLPALAVAIRRLHDTNRSGWWILLGFVPVIGIIVLVFVVQEGTKGDNQFGPDPKAGAV